MPLSILGLEHAGKDETKGEIIKFLLVVTMISKKCHSDSNTRSHLSLACKLIFFQKVNVLYTCILNQMSSKIKFKLKFFVPFHSSILVHTNFL